MLCYAYIFSTLSRRVDALKIFIISLVKKQNNLVLHISLVKKRTTLFYINFRWLLFPLLWFTQYISFIQGFHKVIDMPHSCLPRFWRNSQTVVLELVEDKLGPWRQTGVAKLWSLKTYYGRFKHNFNLYISLTVTVKWKHSFVLDDFCLCVWQLYCSQWLLPVRLFLIAPWSPLKIKLWCQPVYMYIHVLIKGCRHSHYQQNIVSSQTIGAKAKRLLC